MRACVCVRERDRESSISCEHTKGTERKKKLEQVCLKKRKCVHVCERTIGFASFPMMDGSLMAPRKRSSFGLQQISEFFNRHQHRTAIKTISPRQENRL